MKAIVFHGVNDLRYEPNWDDPRPLRPGEARIETAWCGICGTDLEDLREGAIIPIDEPHPESGRMAPLVIGHEFSGVVVEVAPDVTNVEPGDRVAMECLRYCWKCEFCKRGEYASCINQVSVGQHDDGGMAEYFNIPAYDCFKIPDDMPLDIASLTEPLAVMIRAARKGRVGLGDVVTVVGAGAIGLFGIAAARVAGATKVISIAHGGYRAEVAALMGADHVLNSKVDGWHEEFMDITDGHGSDVVFDCGGNIPAIRQAVELARRHGRIVVTTVIDKDVPLSALDIMYNEKEIIGSVAHQHDREFKWALQYLADGRVKPEPMITDRLYIEDAVGKGFDRLVKDRNQIKILVTPNKKRIKKQEEK
jgi:(R,R)-butanediol dehydrogenase/meso-butanediol dehydrogenase/diacetyl reductase